MDFDVQPPLSILPSPARAADVPQKERRRLIRAMSIGYVARGHLLYWGKPFTAYDISFRKGRRLLNRFEMIGAVIFTIGFFGLSFWLASRMPAGSNAFAPSFWLGPTGSTHVFFWLGAACAAFLAYRVIASKDRIDPVESFQRDISSGSSESDVNGRTAHTWSTALALPKRKRKDISFSYTADALHALDIAYALARSYAQKEMTALHLFYALLGTMKIHNVFVRLGVPVSKLQAQIAKSFEKGNAQGDAALSEDARQIIFYAYEYAYQAKQEYTHVTELLLATIRQSSVLQELLYDLEIDRRKLDNVIAWLRIRERLAKQYQVFQKAAARRSKHGLDRAMTAVATPFLNSVSQDMTIAAKYGQLSPCVAREKEIEEIFQMIEGGQQSVLLVGDRGVGKMSIIEGIAQRMVEEDVPKRLRDKRLVQLSVSALLAGTDVGGAEQRLLRVMQEVGKAKNIILFIHNIHDLIGMTGKQGSEGLDVSEALAEYLGPGKFLTIATTTPEAYNQHILNSEIGQVFGRIDVKEMDADQTIQALESKVGAVEYKHQVYFSYNALEGAAALAGKFLHDQRLPESAIAVMTEAASLVKHKRGEHKLVEGDDVAAVISQKTGIPTTSISEDESSKLLRLEEEMHRRVVGQNEAVGLVANALRRARAEIRSQKKPIAAFLFLGPTGVGKTELAKTIAEVYFGGEDRMIRVDMSEYQDRTSIYRLIGQTGQQGTGLLTEAVRQHPFSLVLLDEMEKADPDILNLFLQVFDDGRLTDSVGRVIDFTNTIIIATSNAGTQYVQDQMRQGTELEKIRQSLIRGELKKYYRPEFLNRFDGIVLFKALDRSDIRQVAGFMLKRIEKDLEKRGVFLKVEDAALDALADVGFDPEFGARPMRRAIQEKVENQLADLILQKKLERRDTIVLGPGIRMSVEKGR